MKKFPPEIDKILGRYTIYLSIHVSIRTYYIYIVKI
jgi:hypothetical protein